MIDAFARFELQTLRAAIRLDMKPSRDSIGRRLVAFKGAKPCASLSKANVAKLVVWVDEAQGRVSLRATLVHAVMEIGIFPDGERALFTNTVDIVEGAPIAVVLRPADFDALTRRFDCLTDDLANIVGGLPRRDAPINGGI